MEKREKPMSSGAVGANIRGSSLSISIMAHRCIKESLKLELSNLECLFEYEHDYRRNFCTSFFGEVICR